MTHTHTLVHINQSIRHALETCRHIDYTQEQQHLTQLQQKQIMPESAVIKKGEGRNRNYALHLTFFVNDISRKSGKRQGKNEEGVQHDNTVQYSSMKCKKETHDEDESKKATQDIVAPSRPWHPLLDLLRDDCCAADKLWRGSSWPAAGDRSKRKQNDNICWGFISAHKFKLTKCLLERYLLMSNKII